MIIIAVDADTKRCGPVTSVVIVFIIVTVDWATTSTTRLDGITGHDYVQRVRE